MQSLKDIPAKYLGKKYSQDLQEREQIKQVEEQLKYDLKKIDKCKLPGRYKCWMVQHMLKPRIMWPLSIYNIPLSKVEDMQKKITKSLKRWLKINSKQFIKHLFLFNNFQIETTIFIISRGV